MERWFTLREYRFHGDASRTGSVGFSHEAPPQCIKTHGQGSVTNKLAKTKYDIEEMRTAHNSILFRNSFFAWEKKNKNWRDEIVIQRRKRSIVLREKGRQWNHKREETLKKNQDWRERVTQTAPSLFPNLTGATSCLSNKRGKRGANIMWNKDLFYPSSEDSASVSVPIDCDLVFLRLDDGLEEVLLL